jgi:nitroimidazol reductase NimA-like FMN-containing flavoprotein (pyridoxamine 5'-phosphate oxidase superfamily)
MSRMIDLTLAECLELLHIGSLGRVAFSTPLGPRIVPVNYAMHGDDIVLRTAPFSELGTFGWDCAVAFEVDHVDVPHHEGWSVVALGRSELVSDAEQLYEIRRGWKPSPWAAGQRHLYISVHWRELTGRRVGAERGAAEPTG